MLGRNHGKLGVFVWVEHKLTVPDVEIRHMPGVCDHILNSIMLIIKISFVTTFVLVLWVTIGADPGYSISNPMTTCARVWNFALTATVLNKNLGDGKGSSVV